MKKFDVYLQRAHVPEWKENYIDYVILKDELKRFGKRRRDLQRGNLEWSDVLGTAGSDDNNLAFRYTLQGSSSGEDMVGTNNDRLSTLERDEFKRLLQEQLEKATRFFQASWIKFQSTSHAEEKDEEDEILELYGFAVVNICTLRQVILKFNAHSRMYNGTIFVSEYEVFNQPQASPHDIEGEESIDFSVQTVVPPLLTLMEPLQARVITMPSYWMMSDTPEALSMRQAGGKPLTNFRARVEELEALLEQTSWKQQTRQSPNRSERFLMTVRSFYLAGTANLGISMEPKFLHAQVRGFKKEMKAIALWREKPLLIGFGIDDESATGTVIGEMDPANVWPLFLNLVGCFLFMMNNYIIEPSSAYYANALGSSDALSGIMMGMAPWFALVSAVGYSVWTNTSYKQPILFAGTLMVIGNTLYGAAYAHQSMSMCLVGRAICGFGAPRIINRRYVADATPFSLRTISSAAFALTTAVGAASGPGAAILLDLIPEFNFYLPFLGVQTFNGMTGPGFLMALLWLIFAVAIVVSFGEPTRSGLDELKQREALERKKESEASLIEDLYDDDDSVGSLSVGSYDRRCHAGSKHSPLYCIRHMTRATALCMALIFMKRIALEVRNEQVELVHITVVFICIFSHFRIVSFSPEHCWINVYCYEKQICLVHSKRWNAPFSKWSNRDSCFHLCRMDFAIS